MSKVDDLIIQAVDNRFKVLANQLKFDRTYYGKVVNIDGRHAIVNINGIEYRAQIKDGMFIVTNDVVVLKAPNGNFSFLYVDGKLGEVANADVKNQIGDLSTLTTTVKDNLVNSINEVDNELNVLYTNGFNGEYRHYDGDLTDLNDFTTPGKFEIVKDLSTIKNLPVNTSGLVRFSIVVEKRISNVYRQEIHFKSTPFFNRAFYRDTLDNGDWGEWAEVATTTKTDILFPYNSGYTTQATHIRNGIVVENNHIYVYINVRKLDGSDVAAGSIIGILPPNCRPDKEIWGTIYLRDYTACYVIITPDGKVIIGGTTNSQYFIGCIDYYI